MRCDSLPAMSTVAEIESAIEKLELHEVEALRHWMKEQAEAREKRMWSPEKLGAVAEQMVAEKDPVRAQALHAQIVAGFYGDADA